MKSCNILDQAQILFPWQKQNAKRDVHKELYDEDDDLIDETIKLNNKKFKKNSDSEVDNYETLNAKWKTINDELCQLKVKLATIGLEPGVKPEVSSDLTDSLDEYLASMNGRKFGLTLNEKIEKSNIRMKIKYLEQQQRKIEKLIQIAKPSEVKLFSSIKIATTVKVEQKVSNNGKIQNSNSIDKNKFVPKISPDKNETKVMNEPLQHHSTNQIKEMDRSQLKGNKAKQMQKLKQDSIIEAIEWEKKKLYGLSNNNHHNHSNNNNNNNPNNNNNNNKDIVIEENDSNYVGWLPPTDQSGDGKTRLNDKFGY